MKKYSMALLLCLVCIAYIFFQHSQVASENWNTYPNLPSPVGTEPFLITSAGQATDGKVFSYLAKDLHLEGDYRPRALASDLYDYHTIVLVTGYSPHGLHQTYRTVEEEKSRVRELVEEAEASGIPLIIVHIGGSSRDDSLTWTFLKESLPHAEYVLGLSQMEQNDKLMSLAKQHKVPVTLVEELSNMRTPFNSAFR
ncbi:DUF6305 family protein [Pontibacillus salicampi]|uniref:DUF6305 family protein n=1 Tax=Pontibacillus salicampi TaxID=1449801 RepID=A0ABV6LSJ5_9BACI